ncbi:MAG: DUF3995 domain-containing protein [Actinomycetota bacterium]
MRSIVRQRAQRRLPLILCGLTALAVMVREFLPARQSMELLAGWTALLGAVAGGASLGIASMAPSRRPVHVFLWSSSVLLIGKAADGIAFDVVGVAMKAVAAASGGAMVVDIPIDPAGIVIRVLAGLAGLAIAGTALRYGRVLRGACERCGRTGGRSSPLTGRTAGYAAAVLAAGYAAQKVYWGLGGTAGLTSPDAFGQQVRLWTPGLGDTAVLALIGAAVALGTVRPWGRRIPRWLTLTVTGLGALMLVPVGLMGIINNITSLSEMSSGTGVAPWVFWVEYPWFLSWGVTLGLAGLSFHYRTQGACPACGAGEAVDGLRTVPDSAAMARAG